MNKALAKRLLRRIDDGLRFRFSNGQSAGTMEELVWGIESLREDEFHHHVYFDHNDFSNWLIDVIGDEELGLRIFALEKALCVNEIKKRIVLLERIISS